MNANLLYQGRSGFPGTKGDSGVKGQKGDGAAGVSFRDENPWMRNCGVNKFHRFRSKAKEEAMVCQVNSPKLLGV